MEIARGRSNAVKVLGRALRAVHATVPFRLVTFAGGKSRNAIPRDAVAIVSVEAGDEDAFRGALETAITTIQDSFAKTDSGLSVALTTAASDLAPWTADATSRLLDVIACVPTGPLAMSPDFAGLVETSTSLGEAATEGDALTLHRLSRSSHDSAMPDVVATLDAAAGLRVARSRSSTTTAAGARPRFGCSRGCAPRVREALRASPVVTAVHAGLETSVIGGKVDRPLDMLAIGPQIEFLTPRRACQYSDCATFLVAVGRNR
jgi:dipeptidase D